MLSEGGTSDGGGSRGDHDWSSLTLWSDREVRDENGTVAICFGLSATIYFHYGHTAERRRAALECFNDYDMLVGPSLRWHSVGAESRRMSPVSKLRSRDMAPYLLSARWEEAEAREHAWAYYWHGGARPDDASPVLIHAYGSPRMYAELDNSLSFLRVSFPVLWFGEKTGEFPALLQRWCQRLKPYHGYGGITVLESPESGLAQFYSPRVAAFGTRYPGLEVDVPMSHKLAAHDGIKGGNWLTVLADTFVRRLGGEASLRERLGGPFAVERYDGGVMIVAGSVPEVGDRNRGVGTPLYRRLARVLRPIRISEHPRPYAKGRFAEEGEFSAWLARFDE